ncbi:hypothetical protein K470DRAFT_299556 [Piedraia hortae CBS 480.64]|uniref:Uncharacterized protein n=1 Tax=Piedraia hortae CBS 480.64 TaxID=1314780 RepID=A0A6A7C197_9PEZI|nr:hypothetical protein K470DRAFT_299556 [Piedraia hortae CBS 480.64]
MSQDLLAAFGEAPPSDRLPKATIDDDNFDDFGDFEDASTVAAHAESSRAPAWKNENPFESKPSFSTQKVVAPGSSKKEESVAPNPLPIRKATPQKTGEDSKIGRHPFAGNMALLFDDNDGDYNAGVDEIDNLAMNPEAAMAYSKKVIREQMEKQDGLPTASDSNILFDVDDYTKEDKGGNDLLSWENDVPTSATAVEVEDDGGWDDFEAAPAAMGANNQAETEDWWDEFQPAASKDIQAAHEEAGGENRSSPSPTAKGSTVDPDPSELPPTNIPPPSLLLSLFPPSFTEVNTILLSPLSKLPISSTDRIAFLSDPATHQYLSSHLQTARVLGHIIAGRKARWKRDIFLSQGMRIGASSGKGGMKLAGIDRAELRKEDREVLDVLALWGAQVGKVRAAVAGANSNARSKGQTIQPPPELSVNMKVTCLAPAEGGFRASRQCALCGLRREERVDKLDVNIEDSFGEWWLDAVLMHTECWAWWRDNRDRLR